MYSGSDISLFGSTNKRNELSLINANFELIISKCRRFEHLASTEQMKKIKNLCQAFDLYYEKCNDHLRKPDWDFTKHDSTTNKYFTKLSHIIDELRTLTDDLILKNDEFNFDTVTFNENDVSSSTKIEGIDNFNSDSESFSEIDFSENLI